MAVGRPVFLLIVPLVLAVVLFKRVRVRHKSLRWLGGVSYAIYLVHGTILYVLAWLFRTRTTHPVGLLLAGVVLTIVLAWPFHLLVEQPSIRLGRWISRRMFAVNSPPQSGSNA